MRKDGWLYYSLMRTGKLHTEAVMWCYSHLKPGETVTWHGMQFWFKTREDWTMFTLKWL